MCPGLGEPWARGELSHSHKTGGVSCLSDTRHPHPARRGLCLLPHLQESSNRKALRATRSRETSGNFLSSSSPGLGVSTHSPHHSLASHLDWSAFPIADKLVAPPPPPPCSQHSLIPCLKAHTDHLSGMFFPSPEESSSALRPD